MNIHRLDKEKTVANHQQDDANLINEPNQGEVGGNQENVTLNGTGYRNGVDPNMEVRDPSRGRGGGAVIPERKVHGKLEPQQEMTPMMMNRDPGQFPPNVWRDEISNKGIPSL